MAATEEQGYRRHHERHSLVPAGVLIGLGVGIITGYAAAGVLIGLGLGLAASAFLRQGDETPADPDTPCCRRGNRWVSAIVGIFLIIIGAALVWAPVNIWSYIWPYGVGIFLVLIGLSFVAKMWNRIG
jgi:uncharacterized membrane protein HdeD (DUF308 family)